MSLLTKAQTTLDQEGVVVRRESYYQVIRIVAQVLSSLDAHLL